jgi:DNA-directed RNA polymerase subunit RPC12/RpoP
MLVQHSSHSPRTCPNCESRRIAHSRRPGVWGWPLVRWLPVQVYRCTDCWHRFVGFKWRRMTTATQALKP